MSNEPLEPGGPEEGRTLVGDVVAALFGAAGVVREQGDEVARNAGQSLPRWEVLYILGEAPASAADAGRRLGRSRQAVQRVIDLLEAEGLIVEMPNPAHKRSSLFRLTETGRQTLVTINDAAGEWHEMVMREFGAGDLRALMDSLRRMTRVAERWFQEGGSEREP